MYESAPQHGAVWARDLVADLRSRGFSDDLIFRDSGLKPWMLEGEHAAVSFVKIAALFENAAELTDDDLLGLRYGQEREGRRGGLISYVGLSSPTVLNYAKNMARYSRVFSDAIEMDTSALEETGLMTWIFRVSGTVQRRQHNEFSAAGFLHSLREATHRRIEPLEVAFRHPRNRHYGAFREFFGCDVRFGCDINHIRFRMPDLDIPLRTADQHLLRVLMDCCEEFLKRKRPLQSNLVLDVERAVTERLSAGEANQNRIASDLGMSRRTLSRRLAAEGTSFLQIIENLRKSLALNYLRHSSISQSEIAYLLGYADLSSYITAFKRWTGETPGQYRKA